MTASSAASVTAGRRGAARHGTAQHIDEDHDVLLERAVSALWRGAVPMLADTLGGLPCGPH